MAASLDDVVRWRAAMRRRYGWYLPISQEELQAIWDSATVSVDANVLLDLYLHHPEFHPPPRRVVRQARARGRPVGRTREPQPRPLQSIEHARPGVSDLANHDAELGWSANALGKAHVVQEMPHGGARGLQLAEQVLEVAEARPRLLLRQLRLLALAPPAELGAHRGQVGVVPHVLHEYLPPSRRPG